MSHQCSHCDHKPIVHCNSYRRSPSPDCSCCKKDEANLNKLKNTNHQLKSLINRLDELSDSVESSYLAHKSRRECNCESFYHEECSLCRSSRETNNNRYYQYDLVICDDCERMVNLSNEFEAWKVKKDPKIYPLRSYQSGKQRECDKCEKCVYESRSRSQRSRSRGSSPIVSTELRPVWNGGPWTSYYTWTNMKLSESKK